MQYRTLTGCCKYDNEPTCFVKCSELFESVIDSQPSVKEPAFSCLTVYSALVIVCTTVHNIREILHFTYTFLAHSHNCVDC